MSNDVAEGRLGILYLSQYFFPESFLGNDVARALVARSHDLVAVSSVPNYPEGKFFSGFSNKLRRIEHWHGIKIIRAWTVRRGNSRVRLLINYLVYPFAASWEILRLGGRGIDVSFVFMPSPIFQGLAGIFAKHVFGIPTVFWVQDIWPDSAVVTLNIKSRIINSILNAFCSYIYRSADLLMVQSNAFIPRLEQLGVERSKITVVPNMAPTGFDRVTREDVDPAVRMLVPTDKFVVMFAGNIGASQDFDTILEAASILKSNENIIWVILGSGRDEDRVRKVIENLDLGRHVLLLGRHPIELMPHFFSCADVLLLSLKANELFDMTVPSKLQSYLACGQPLVGSLGGEGARIILESGAGISVPPSDPSRLAAAVVSLSHLSKEELSQMGRNGYRYAKNNYDSDLIFDSIENLLFKVVENCRAHEAQGSLDD
ncbi:glycosyltransferase family 4 protein [Microcoleus sp. F10-B2]